MKHPHNSLTVTILGSGTSTGVPVIGCRCAVCKSPDPKNNRTRAAVMITDAAQRHIIIDTGPEFRLQMLREDVSSLEAVLYTHLHADHCHGFDDLRAFYFQSGKPINCYLTQELIDEMKIRFAYAFEKTGYLGTRPQVDIHVVKDYQPFTIGDVEVESFGVEHGDVTTSVFRLNRFAYATDFKRFTERQIQAWRGKISVMVASGIHFGAHKTHSVIPETLELFKQLGVERGVITHLSHDVDYLRDAGRLPDNVVFAYDGMRIDVD